MKMQWNGLILNHAMHLCNFGTRPTCIIIYKPHLIFYNQWE